MAMRNMGGRGDTVEIAQTVRGLVALRTQKPEADPKHHVKSWSRRLICNLRAGDVGTGQSLRPSHQPIWTSG